MKFAAALYTDNFKIDGETAGEMYLNTHDLNNKDTVNNLLCKDITPGIKDFRSLSFELNGSKHEILLSLLITEMISYMSSLQISNDAYQKVSENGRQRRGGSDARYEVAAEMFRDIVSNPKIRAEFDGYNLFTATSESGKKDLLSLMEKSITN